MELENLLKCYIEAYFGVQDMDEYDLKEFTLKDMETYIKDFIITNNINRDYCKKISNEIKDNIDIRIKLQSSLILLSKMNAPMELILLIKNRLKKQD